MNQNSIEIKKSMYFDQKTRQDIQQTLIQENTLPAEISLIQSDNQNSKDTLIQINDQLKNFIDKDLKYGNP